MLKNKYFHLILILTLLNVLTIIVGRFFTMTDWALVLFLTYDKEIHEKSSIGYVLTLGLLNDYFNMTFFGVTPLLFIILLIVRWGVIKNFDFDEIQRIRVGYYVTAIFSYVCLLLLITGYREAPLIIDLLFHSISNVIFLFLFKAIKEYKVAFSYT